MLVKVWTYYAPLFVSEINSRNVNEIAHSYSSSCNYYVPNTLISCHCLLKQLILNYIQQYTEITQNTIISANHKRRKGPQLSPCQEVENWNPQISSSLHRRLPPHGHRGD